ncbi:MAG: hypothetical protein AAF830_03310 [Pseudomonadota bacterium]
MLLLGDGKVTFFHIPKCAGSTLRDQLENYDSLDGQFSRRKEHPELGRYEAAHVPLFRLRKYWPEVFEKVATTSKYAVVRDPVARFCSAISQNIRENHDVSPGHAPKELIEGVIATAREDIAKNPEFPAFGLSHFCHQTDFIDLDGERFVDSVYPLEELPTMIRDIGDAIGVKLMDDIAANKTVTFKNEGLAGPLTKLKDISKNVLPFPVYTRAREAAMKVFTKPGSENVQDTVRGSAELMAFIREHYAGDFAVYEESRAKHAA